MNGDVIDYFNGVEDLKLKKIRFVGNTRQRISEDYLRILRFFRFLGRISKPPYNVDSEVLSAITELRNGLKDISTPRIWTELKQILVGNNAGYVVSLMDQCGVFEDL
ncbi:MAG: CCA tRNA nucleotidyltransferase 1, mitochondrial, partial [Paramarteilia canceri]